MCNDDAGTLFIKNFKIIYIVVCVVRCYLLLLTLSSDNDLGCTCIMRFCCVWLVCAYACTHVNLNGPQNGIQILSTAAEKAMSVFED